MGCSFFNKVASEYALMNFRSDVNFMTPRDFFSSACRKRSRMYSKNEFTVCVSISSIAWESFRAWAVHDTPCILLPFFEVFSSIISRACSLRRVTLFRSLNIIFRFFSS